MPTSEYSTAEIKDYTGISLAAREEHHLISMSLEKRRTVAYISARSGSIVRSRQSSWLFVRHFVDRLGALRERNTVATIAKRVLWCELRETERKRDKWKNKERGAREEKRGEPGERLRLNRQKRRRKSEMSEGDRKDSRNPGRRGEKEGESASFLRDASRLERTALRPSFSLPLDATYYARFPWPHR